MVSTVSVDKAKLFNKFGYEPMAHQNEYHYADARFRVVAGGRRLGKSQMAGMDRTADLVKPKNLGWIVGPTYDLGAKEFRVMYDALVVKAALGKRSDVRANFNIKQGDMYIEMPWGARVEVRSATHPEGLVGEGLDWLICSEAAKLGHDTYEKFLRPALSDKRGSADFVSTPEGKNWFYDQWLRGRDPNRPEYWSRRYPSWVNTVMYPGGREDPEIRLMRETTLEEWFDQEIAALFTAVVGRIYGEFDETKHVLEKHWVFRPEWPNYIAFDWGFANPLAAVEFQVSPQDEIVVWREHYHSFRTLEWHCNTLKERPNPEGYHLDMGFGDAADPEAVEYVSQHLVPCMADPDSKQWLTGIRLVKRFLKLDHQHSTDMDDEGRPILKPRYFIDPSCKSHIDEIQGYKTKNNVGPNEFNGAGVVATGCADHTLDAMRYALMHLFEIGSKHHLSDVYPQKKQSELDILAQREREQSRLQQAGTFFSLVGSGRPRRF